jgi:UDP-4-amino-4,6-dideoxy-N-acetyl-beta-L-altrosamine N-acetyltransferase
MKIVFKEYSTLNERESFEILSIRNRDFIRKNMITSEIISSENHMKWINSLKNNSDKKYLAVLCENEVIGSCSWVKEKAEYTWGIFFKEEVNPIISSCCAYLFLENCFFNDKIEKLGSLVKKENSIAFSFNKNFGFKIYKEDEDYFYLKLEQESWENNKNSRLLKPIKNYLDKIEYEFK